MITQERLAEVLEYGPDDGSFVWLVSRGTMKAGAKAGSLPNRDGYISIKIDRRLYRAHRLAWLYMTGTWPKSEIDHIDGIGANNQFANLREATHGQNMGNKKSYKNSAMGLKGVSQRGERFRAYISIGGKRTWLGNYNCPTAAHFAYTRAAKQLFGEFARAL